MKILYITTIGGTMSFFKRLIKELVYGKHTVDIASNETNSPVPSCYREWGCKVYPISCTRSPFNAGTLKAIKEIRKITEEGSYDIVHCHTPIAAMCARLACQSLRKKGLKVIYTAHGFHFYKGAPFKNWLLYFPIEWLCSFFTDVLITINQEDFDFSQKALHARQNEYVPGVGIDTEKFFNAVVDCEAKRAEIGVPADCTLLMSVGELNKNKNHEVVIRAIAQINNPDIHYVIAGKGELRDYLISLAESLNVASQVHLLGYRSDVAELNKSSDLFVFPSLREGLPVSLMESMACGIPCVASNIRGNIDLLGLSPNCLFNPHEVSSCKYALCKALASIDTFSRIIYKTTLAKYSSKKVIERIHEIYRQQMLSQEASI